MGQSAGSFVQHMSHYPHDFFEPGREVWALNAAAAAVRHDMAFNMHDLEELQKREPERDYIGFYKKYNRPVVTVRALDELPLSLEFPYQEMWEKYKDEYFSCGLSYLVAAAGMVAKEVFIFGADFNYRNRSAYEAGRANLEYWIGKISSLGVQVFLPNDTTLCDQDIRVTGKGVLGYGRVYGYFGRQPQVDSGTMTLMGFDDPEKGKDPEMEEGERQVSPELDGIRQDHKERYEWAVSCYKDTPLEGRWLDACCGVGYGAKMLAEGTGQEVWAFDSNPGALKYASRFYADPLIRYALQDAENMPETEDVFGVCTAFECLEHVKEPGRFLRWARKHVKVLLGSVPNESGFPWSPQIKFHFRHYTRAEIGTLLNENGWQVINWGFQEGPQSPVVEGKSDSARTLVFAAELLECEAE